ncbi:MAG TPA: glycosyltransferase family 4 protein [Pyrinomonadaceae bacterium]
MMRFSKPTVLAVGHGAAATGFSRVLDSVIQRLSQTYDFHHFATNHGIDRVDGNWPIYGNPDRRDPNGLDRLGELINRVRPEVVLFLNDLWFCCVHAHRMKSMPEPPTLVAYCPVDGILTRPELYSQLGFWDQIVAYTQFGRAQLERIHYLDEPLSSHCLTNAIEIIPHGVDTDVFFPLQPHDLLDRSLAKQQFFGDGAAEAGFVVLNAAKHDVRKRMDLTIEGFARFVRNKPRDVKLYLHTGATFDGPDIRVLAERAGIADRLISTDGWLEDHPAIDDERLNLLYNATDVGINTSGGEGWGLISFEHAATGAPQIVPAHSGCEELWRDVETTLPVRTEGEYVGLGMMRQFVGPDDVAAVLERLYSDRGFRAEQAQKGYENARQPAYQWDQIAVQWDELLQRVLATRK